MFFNIIIILTAILICYGKYNSFRIVMVGMQKITELYQYLNRIVIKSILPLNLQ